MVELEELYRIKGRMADPYYTGTNWIPSEKMVDEAIRELEIEYGFKLLFRTTKRRQKPVT